MSETSLTSSESLRNSEDLAKENQQLRERLNYTAELLEMQDEAKYKMRLLQAIETQAYLLKNLQETLKEQLGLISTKINNVGKVLAFANNVPIEGNTA